MDVEDLLGIILMLIWFYKIIYKYSLKLPQITRQTAVKICTAVCKRGCCSGLFSGAFGDWKNRPGVPKHSYYSWGRFGKDMS